MSRGSGDFYYSSSSRSRGGSQTPHLPPIRDVVGDVLQQPARPASSGYDVRRSSDRSYTSSPRPQLSSSASCLQLPPIHSQRSSEATQPRYGTYSTSSARNHQAYSSSPRASQTPIQRGLPPQRGTTPAHSYDVFVSTSNEGLVHKRSSNKDDFHHVPKEDAIANSTGRHACHVCGRRFEKLSTLKNHLTTHSGDKPYECPDCGKCFSVSSNMRRHQLTHGSGAASSDKSRP